MRQFVCLSVCLCLDMAVADLCLLPIAYAAIYRISLTGSVSGKRVPRKNI